MQVKPVHGFGRRRPCTWILAKGFTLPTVAHGRVLYVQMLYKLASVKKKEL